MKNSTFLFCLFFFLTTPFISQAGNETPQELGTVNWLRDYNQAISRAKAEDKQVLILFQEVPGCSTCRNYGKNVLSNPLLVEAIEEYFIPLAIYNNKDGDDAFILAKYNEPSWNNPVVRIVNHQGQNEVARLSSNYSTAGLYQSMKKALNKKGTKTARYFDLLGEELSAQKKGTVKEEYFKMYCFWSGEGHLGNQEGVIATEPGFMGGHEVVKVKYDSGKVSKNQLQQYAAQAKCAPIAHEGGYTPDKDLQYYLKKSTYRYLPLSNIQRTKVNSALAKGKDPRQYLSPQQMNWYTLLEQGKVSKVVRYLQPIEKAWTTLSTLWGT